jgi:prepilin-type N-terminal cleavage/methylation domain-containing protein
MKIRYTCIMKQAFTLVEVVVSISILVIVMVAVSAFQYDVLNYNRSSATTLTNTQEAQSMIKVMAKEIRSMSPSSNGAYPILSAGTSTVTFFADVDADGTKELIHYYIGTTTTTINTIYRGSIKPSGSPLTYSGVESKKILATGIRNSSSTPLFEYFGSAYTGTSTAMTYPLAITTIRLVKINITIDTDPSKIPVLKTFTTQVSLRNLKDNL